MSDDIFKLIRRGLDEDVLVLLPSKLKELNENKQTLLHEATAYGRERIVKELISLRADSNVGDELGQTPLHYAIAHNNVQIVEMLLRAGADTNIADIYGNTPMWTAVFNARGEYKIVKLMLSYGAECQTKNNAGRTPIDFAKQIGDESLIDMLNEN